MENFVTNMFETLLAGGRIMVGKTGYFAVERKAAHVEGGRLYPPLRQMVFVPDASVEDAGDGSASATEGLQVWMPELKHIVAQQLAVDLNAFEVQGIGVFVKEEGAMRYIRTESGEALSVPLPAAVEATPHPEPVPDAPSEPVPDASAEPAPVMDEETDIAFEPEFAPQGGLSQPDGGCDSRKTGWLAAAVILLLLVLGAGGGYLFSAWRNGQRPQPVGQHAASPAPAVSPAVPEVQPAAPAEQSVPAAAAVSSEPPTAGIPGPQPGIHPDAPAVQPVAAKEPLDLYVYTPDHSARYYVIVASLTTEPQAQGQLRRLSEQGLAALRIVRFDADVYRLVSGPGCSTYAEAKELLQQVRTVAEKAWIFQNQ